MGRKIVFSMATGLNTEPGPSARCLASLALDVAPTSPCLGLRRFVAKCARTLMQNHGFADSEMYAEFFSYSAFPSQHWQPVDWLDRYADADVRILGGHSFGLAVQKWLLDNVSAVAASHALGKRYEGFADLLLNMDGAPNGDRFHQFFPWQIGDLLPQSRWRAPDGVTKSSLSFYQRNEQAFGIGICGVPFSNCYDKTQEAGFKHSVVNVTRWLDRNGKPLDHCSMVDDDVLHARAEVAVVAACLGRSTGE